LCFSGSSDDALLGLPVVSRWSRLSLGLIVLRRVVVASVVRVFLPTEPSWVTVAADGKLGALDGG